MHKNPSEQGHPAIRLTGVSKTYGSLRALDGISLSIAQGEFFGLLGPNGAGKTTLMRALSGAVPATSGE
ncbi:MAG: ATP-binding cassette domain-containing protein, partial [Betaproteobacteria bacterium]|nr:ATP-binding cassette domain-containing protein [Betaproteobacteria bacterium]